MTELLSTHFKDGITGSPPTDCGKPQRGAATPTLAVAPPAPCDAPTVSITSTRFLRLPELLARLGVCRATIYLHMAAGKFPKSISLGPRAVGWLEHEIDAWLAAKMKARHDKNGGAFSSDLG